MQDNTVKTLVDYIVKLNRHNSWLENPDRYVNDELDTNGVGMDHVETFWPPDTHSGADK